MVQRVLVAAWLRHGGTATDTKAHALGASGYDEDPRNRPKLREVLEYVRKGPERLEEEDSRKPAPDEPGDLSGETAAPHNVDRVHGCSHSTRNEYQVETKMQGRNPGPGERMGDQIEVGVGGCEWDRQTDGYGAVYNGKGSRMDGATSGTSNDSK